MQKGKEMEPSSKTSDDPMRPVADGIEDWLAETFPATARPEKAPPSSSESTSPRGSDKS